MNLQRSNELRWPDHEVIVNELRWSDHEVIVGDFSIADCACARWLELAEFFGIEMGSFDNVNAWMSRMQARTSWSAERILNPNVPWDLRYAIWD